MKNANSKSFHPKNIDLYFAILILFFLTHLVNAEGKHKLNIISIHAAKADTNNDYIPDLLGKEVKVAGRVSFPSKILSSLFLEAYIQDSSGGIFLFSKNYRYDLELGDSVIATGRIGQYMGQVELNDPNVRIIKSTIKRIPQPLSISLNKNNAESYQGTLVKVEVRVINKLSNNGGTSLSVVERNGSDFLFSIFTSKYSADNNILDGINIGDIIEVTGILGKYDGEMKPNSFYQIYPRYTSDIVEERGKTFFLINYIIGLVGILIIVLLWVISLKIQVKKRTKKLSESEEKFRMLAESVSYLIIIFDGNGFLYTNPATEIITGYSSGELKGKKFWDLMHPENKEIVKERGLARISGEKVLANYEIKILTKNDEIKWLDYSAALIKYKDKNALIGTAYDITEKHNIMKELKKFSYAIEQSPLSIIITNTKGDIEYVNPKFSQISGYNFDEVIGKNPRFLKSGETPATVYKELWDSIISGKEWHGEFKDKKKSGEFFWESVSISPVKNELSEITNYLAIKEDITHKKFIENELIIAKDIAEEMNRIKSNFLANMSHELRTPMNGILGLSDHLELTLKENEEKEIAHMINKSGKRLMETLNQLLDLARIEAEKQDIHLEPTLIAFKINDVINLFKINALKKNVTLHFIDEYPGVTLLVDDSIISQVLNNLIDNAIKYTEKGSVTVKLRKKIMEGNDSVIIEIIDTGIGIPKELLGTIFEEFRQASEGWGRKFEGTGLGLTLTKKFVGVMGGTIAVDSIPGKGSILTLTFKTYSAPIDNPNQVIDIIAVKNYVNEEISLPLILLVEDDDSTKLVSRLFLKDYCVMEFAGSGEEAINLVEKTKYQAIFMDINMKGMGGIEAAKRIKKMKNKSHIPIVAFTAFAMKGDKERFMDEGFDYYISKPFTKEDLIKLYNSIMSVNS